MNPLPGTNIISQKFDPALGPSLHVRITLLDLDNSSDANLDNETVSISNASGEFCHGLINTRYEHILVNACILDRIGVMRYKNYVLHDIFETIEMQECWVSLYLCDGVTPIYKIPRIKALRLPYTLKHHDCILGHSILENFNFQYNGPDSTFKLTVVK